MVAVDCDYVCNRCKEFMEKISKGIEMSEEEELAYLLDCDICDDFCGVEGG